MKTVIIDTDPGRTGIDEYDDNTRRGKRREIQKVVPSPVWLEELKEVMATLKAYDMGRAELLAKVSAHYDRAKWLNEVEQQ